MEREKREADEVNSSQREHNSQQKSPTRKIKVLLFESPTLRKDEYMWKN